MSDIGTNRYLPIIEALRNRLETVTEGLLGFGETPCSVRFGKEGLGSGSSKEEKDGEIEAGNLRSYLCDHAQSVEQFMAATGSTDLPLDGL